MKNEFINISKDKSMLDIELVFGFLSTSYRAKERTKEQVKKSIENSTCFGLYDSADQIGFARVVTDQTTFAYICDFFIIEECKKKGHAQQLMTAILSDNLLENIPKWYLTTKDAQPLYRKFGFKEFVGQEKVIMTIPR